MVGWACKVADELGSFEVFASAMSPAVHRRNARQFAGSVDLTGRLYARRCDSDRKAAAKSDSKGKRQQPRGCGFPPEKSAIQELRCAHLVQFKQGAYLHAIVLYGLFVPLTASAPPLTSITAIVVDDIDLPQRVKEPKSEMLCLSRPALSELAARPG
jgi:hypothetical protein